MGAAQEARPSFSTGHRISKAELSPAVWCPLCIAAISRHLLEGSPAQHPDLRARNNLNLFQACARCGTRIFVSSESRASGIGRNLRTVDIGGRAVGAIRIRS